MLLKFAYAETLSVERLGQADVVRKSAHRAVFAYEPRPGFLYVRSRAISSRTNDNYDTFPGPELEASWMTFIGRPVFVNHNNDDPTRARGVIIDAALHVDTALDGSEDTWVEVLQEIDALRFPKLAQAIVNGDIERTSMGCDVAYSLCSFCGNKAATPLEYCVHIPRLKGKRIRRVQANGSGEDVLVHEICFGLGFFENSLLVEPPADPTAFFLGVDTRGMAMTASRTGGSGQDRLVGRGVSASKKTSSLKRYVVVQTGEGGGAGGVMWDLHIDGCGDIFSPKYTMSDKMPVEAEDWKGALEAFIDPQMEDQGWAQTDVRVLSCAKSGVPVVPKPLAEGQCPSSGTFLDNPKRMHSLPCPGCGKRVKMNYVSGKVPRHKPYISPNAALDDFGEYGFWYTKGERAQLDGLGAEFDYDWAHDLSDRDADSAKDAWFRGYQAGERFSSPAYASLRAAAAVLPPMPATGDLARQHPGSLVIYDASDKTHQTAVWYKKGNDADPSGATIIALFVADSMRHQGIATKLLDMLALEFEGHAIDPGGLTTDGAGLWASWSQKWPDVNGIAWIEDPDEFYAEEDIDSQSYHEDPHSWPKRTAKDDKDHGDTDKGNTTDRGYGWKHQQKREELLEDDPKCHWCHDAKATQADHTTGGKLVPSCAPCNNERSHEQQKRSNRRTAEMKPLGKEEVPSGKGYVLYEWGEITDTPEEWAKQFPLFPYTGPGWAMVTAFGENGLGSEIIDTGGATPEEALANAKAEYARDWGPGWQKRFSLRTQAYGEVKAPAQIDTLRIRECPVCGEEDSWDGDGRCRACGYLPPPEPFRDPDLDVAQKADMREGPVNPEIFKAPPFVVPEDKPEDEDDNKLDPSAQGTDPSLTFRSSNPVRSASTPNKVQSEGEPMSRPSVATLASQQAIIERQGEQIKLLRQQKAALLRRFADVDNPGNPVAEPGSESPSQGTSNEDVRSADANTEVTTPGGVMDPPPPMATTTPTAPGAAASTDALLVANEAPTETTSVTAPVGNAGTQPPLTDTKTEITPETGGEAIGPNYLSGDWANKAASLVAMTQEHTLASLRLARLRLQAGTAQGDDLSLAQRIAATMELPAVRAEIKTLAAVAKARPAAPRPVGRTAARSMPSLVSSPSPMQTLGSRPSMDPSDDEFLWVD